MGHGGKREGSGRKLGVKKIARKPYCFRLSESEHKAVKAYIELIKTQQKACLEKSGGTKNLECN